MSETVQLPDYLETFIKDHLVPVGLTEHQPKGHDLVVWNPKWEDIRFKINYVMEKEPNADDAPGIEADMSLKQGDMVINIFTRVWESYTPCWRIGYNTLLDLLRPAVQITEWIRTTDYRLDLPNDLPSFRKTDKVYTWTVLSDLGCPGCPCKWLNFYYWDRYMVDCTVDGSLTMRVSRPMAGKPYAAETARAFLDDVRAWCSDKDNKLMSFYRHCARMSLCSRVPQ